MKAIASSENNPCSRVRDASAVREGQGYLFNANATSPSFLHPNIPVTYIPFWNIKGPKPI